MENVWSRQARRKRQQQLLTIQRKDEGGGDEIGGGHEGFHEDETMLGFKVLVKQTGEQNVEVKIRWIKGKDAVLFESFCGMLKRKVEGR
jgi:23S rRNA (adenine1618-N6)-methyltransferase